MRSYLMYQHKTNYIHHDYINSIISDFYIYFKNICLRNLIDKNCKTILMLVILNSLINFHLNLGFLHYKSILNLTLQYQSIHKNI